MAATKKRAASKSPPKKTDPAGSCQQVMSDYFDLTGDTLEEQVDLCRQISKKLVEGKYTAEDAQKDWQTCVDRTADYSREATRLWFEGLTRCSFAPGDWFPSSSQS